VSDSVVLKVPRFTIKQTLLRRGKISWRLALGKKPVGSGRNQLFDLSSNFPATASKGWIWKIEFVFQYLRGIL
jgi:hypothetical protein